MFRESVSFAPHADPSALLTHLEQRLTHAGAAATFVGPDRVRFLNPWPFFGPAATSRSFAAFANWWSGRDRDRYALGPFSRGEVVVDAGLRRVTYDLGIGRLVAVATGAIALMAAFVTVLAPTRPVRDAWIFAVFLPLGWCWLVFPAALIGRARFRAFVWRSLASEPRLSQQALG